MSEIVRTVKLKLDVPFSTARHTIAAWTNACNTVGRGTSDNGGISNGVRLHNLADDGTEGCGLSTQVAQSCIRHVGSKDTAMRSTGVRPCLFKDQLLLGQQPEQGGLPSCGPKARSDDAGLNPVEGAGTPPATSD
jgi:hypothetical protein